MAETAENGCGRGRSSVTDDSDSAKYQTCPMCSPDAKPARSTKFPGVDFDECVVKVKNEFVAFSTTRDYVTENFPDLNQSTYKVPAAFSYSHPEGPSNYDFKRDEELETPPEIEILVDRRQKEAVEVVAKAITRWGKKNMEPMFIISEYEFLHFLGNVYKKSAGKKKYEKIIRKKDANIGDHDIMVLMKKGKVVFVQVKSVAGSSAPTTKRKQLKSALKQVTKDKMVIQDMNRDLPFMKHLQMIGLVATPNLSCSHLREVYICDKHQDMTLTECALWNEETFDRWWEEKLEESPGLDARSLSLEEYTKLLGKYVGLGSIVKYRTVVDAIHKVGSRLDGYGLEKLTPEQAKVLENDEGKQKKKIIFGDFGTGKSLLMARKAKQLAETGDHVYIISLSVVSDGSGKVHEEHDNCVEHLGHLVSRAAKEHGSGITVRSFFQQFSAVGCRSSKCRDQTSSVPFELSPEILGEVMENTISDHDQNIHFFLDEVPLCIGQHGWSRFENVCDNYPDMYVWISIAVCSYALKSDENYESMTNEIPASFSRSSLTRCMRMPRNGFSLVQAVRKFKCDGHLKISECGTKVDGPEPKWYELPRCTCEAKPLYHCNCLGNNRIKVALKIIMGRELYGTAATEIVIIMHDTSGKMTKFLSRAVNTACKELNVDYEYKGSSAGKNDANDSSGTSTPRVTNGSNNNQSCGFSSNAYKDNGINDSYGNSHRAKSDLSTVEPDGFPNMKVTLVDFWSYKGSESKVVIYLDPYGGPIVRQINSRWSGFQDVAGTLARSLAQIFYVTWPYEEQELFLADFGRTLEEAARSEKDEKTRKFQTEIANEVKRRDEKGSFMEFLVLEGVITKI